MIECASCKTLVDEGIVVEYYCLSAFVGIVAKKANFCVSCFRRFCDEKPNTHVIRNLANFAGG